MTKKISLKNKNKNVIMVDDDSIEELSNDENECKHDHEHNNTDASKQCKECNINKQLSDFSKGAVCRDCVNGHRREKNAIKNEGKEPDVVYSQDFLDKVAVATSQKEKSRLYAAERQRRARERIKEQNKTNKITVLKKVCTGPLCNGKELDSTKFSEDITKKGGLQIYCKDCVDENKKIKAEEYVGLDIKTTKKVCGSYDTETKQDKGCGKEKLLSDFSLSSTGKFGRHNLCTDCRVLDRKTYDIIDDGTKYCTSCKEEHDINDFVIDTSISGGHRSQCKKMHALSMKQIKSKLENFLVLIVKNMRSNAKKRKIHVTINYNDIHVLYTAQNGKCALTGTVMTHTQLTERTEDSQHILNPENISIDRIDSSKGYTKDNIQLVCAIVNRIKYTLSLEQLINFCLDVQIHKTYKKYNEIVSPTELDKVPGQMVKRIKQKLNFTQGNAKRRDLNVEIEEEQLLCLYKKQLGLCAITGCQLTCDKSDSDISVDRTDSSESYTEENVQLISELANHIKSDIETNVLYDWTGRILDHFGKKDINENIVSKN